MKFNDLYLQNKIFANQYSNILNRKIKSSDFIGGSSLSKFESSFSEFVGSKYCLGVANGTDALYISLKVLGVNYGDEVITTNHSWISTIETIVACGAKPVLVDTKNNFLINENLIEKNISKKTKAIMIVHLMGNACEMDAIVKISKKYNLPIIEDCAQAHGCKYNKKHVGNFGKLGTFSFFPGKNLGCLGDGGAIISNDKKVITLARKIANHGGLKKNSHVYFGMNSRLDSIQADFLHLKLRNLKSLNDRRIFLANLYFKNLKNIKDIHLPILGNNITHVFHQFVIRVKNRKKLIKYLSKNNIPTGIHYPKMFNNIDYYKKNLKFKKKDLINSNSYENKIISLPIHPFLTKKDILKICKKLKEFYSK